MEDMTQARVTVRWPEEEGDSSFLVEINLNDDNAADPWTTIPADADDVAGLLVSWLKSRGYESFEVEVRVDVFDQKAVYSYHNGVWANSDGSVCEDGPELLPTTRR